MIKSNYLVLVVCLLTMPMAMAEKQLKLIGQLGSKAAISIDGVQRILSIGQRSPEGVKLLQVESDYVMVLDNGIKKKVSFSSQFNTQYQKAEVKRVDIAANSRGSYYVPGSINGQIVNFLVDTGATSIAMNSVVAGNLGIDYRYKGVPTLATTASGTVTAYSIHLASVKVGDIHLQNIDAAVLEGGYPTEVLLGMSFLKHVKLERNDNLMTLKYSPR